MADAPIVLVPGFWLGAWAWDEVVEYLRADGHDVTALTLPGLESVDTDRSSITFDDHVEAVCDAIRAKGSPAVLAVHSGTGGVGYAATDRIPELIAQRFPTVMESAATLFDNVVVIGPPLEVCDDSRVMAVDSSMVLALVESSVSASGLRAHADRVRSVGGKLLGVVLVGRQPDRTAA